MADRRLASTAHFRVEWGGPDGSEGFIRVLFQPFDADGGHVELVRAVDGSKALMDWLHGAAKEKFGRMVTITVSDTGGEPVARYRLAGCRPLTLILSEMDALTCEPLLEKLMLSFESIRMDG